MSLLAEIRTIFTGLSMGSARALELPSEYPAWVIRTKEGLIGAGIPCKRDEPLYEKFSMVRLQYMAVQIAGRTQDILFLYIEPEDADIEEVAQKFASLCADFVQPGEEGTNRLSILENPATWWQRWKELMGNRNTDQQIHAIAGELFFYRWILQQGMEVSWTGGSHKRVDFSSAEDDYEVKSTLQRYGMTVTIHGEYQLKCAPHKKLWLILCRLEETEGGESINDLVEELCQLGISRDELELELDKLGFKLGMSSRKKGWHLLELKRYPVTEEFPRITTDDFVGGKFPEGITRLQYDVDLANLPCDTLLAH